MYLYVAFYLINVSDCILKIHGSESLTSFFSKYCFCRFMLIHIISISKHFYTNEDIVMKFRDLIYNIIMHNV